MTFEAEFTTYQYDNTGVEWEIEVECQGNISFGELENFQITRLNLTRFSDKEEVYEFEALEKNSLQLPLGFPQKVQEEIESRCEDALWEAESKCKKSHYGKSIYFATHRP